MTLTWDNVVNESFEIMAYFMLTFMIFSIIMLMIRMLKRFIV